MLDNSDGDCSNGIASSLAVDVVVMETVVMALLLMLLLAGLVKGRHRGTRPMLKTKTKSLLISPKKNS